MVKTTDRTRKPNQKKKQRRSVGFLFLKERSLLHGEFFGFSPFQTTSTHMLFLYDFVIRISFPRLLLRLFSVSAKLPKKTFQHSRAVQSDDHL